MIIKRDNFYSVISNPILYPSERYADYISENRGYEAQYLVRLNIWCIISIAVSRLRYAYHNIFINY